MIVLHISLKDLLSLVLIVSVIVAICVAYLHYCGRVSRLMQNAISIFLRDLIILFIIPVIDKNPFKDKSVIILIGCILLIIWIDAWKIIRAKMIIHRIPVFGKDIYGK